MTSPPETPMELSKERFEAWWDSLRPEEQDLKKKNMARSAWQAAERDMAERAAKVAEEGRFKVSRVQENISTMDNIEMAVRAVQDMITSAIRSLANG